MKDHSFTALRWVLFIAAIGDLAALKVRLVSHDHLVLAGLMTAALLAFGARLVQLVVLRLRGSLDGLAFYARLAVAAGISVALAGGLANWTMGLQGYVILTEQETARLHGGAELQGFDPGPLSDIDELGVVVGLDELKLAPQARGRFSPVSHVQVWRGHEQPSAFTVSPTQNGAAGSLRFYQGAFGFAPRIVILKDQATLFDKVVPFLTERHGPDGIRFSGSFTIEEAGLRVEGAIALDSLDEGMRGHATLDLKVAHDETTLGSGRLLPGHFADLDEGYRVGFAGLQRWSEIVVSRRSYGKVVLVGTILAIAGALSLGLALGRGR